MIVREIITHTEQLLEQGKFDYFNDSKDTLQWLDIIIAKATTQEKREQYQKIRDQLEKQTQSFWDNDFNSLKKKK